MNQTQPKPRTLTGPLVLIVIGSLFLIQNLTPINIFPFLFKTLWRYWPVILIAIGIAKLMEYFRGSKSLPGSWG